MTPEVQTEYEFRSNRALRLAELFHRENSMTKRAEELAQEAASGFGGCTVKDIQAAIEQYGQEVRELCARLSELEEFDCTGFCAKSLREMPLP